MSFAEDENMIETLAPDRADEPLGEGMSATGYAAR